MNSAAIEQPAPTAGQEKVLPAVIRYVEYMGNEDMVADLEARAEMGYGRYGTYLRTYNGRDAAMDCYQELLDGLMYIQQAMMELPPDEVYELVRVRMYILTSLKWLKEYLQDRPNANPIENLATQDSGRGEG